MTSEKWQEKIKASISRRDELMRDWKENVSHRVMKPFTTESESDRVAVPEDWARTRQKKSQLMFNVPRIVALPRLPQSEPAAPIFGEVLNFKLHRELRADVMLDECLSDVVNAAGIMASIVGIEIATEDIEVPEQDISGLPPEQQRLLLQSKQVKMVTAQKPIHQRYYWDRISPAALLWPADFTGSDWDNADWLGYETWLPLVQVMKLYGDKLPPDFKPPQDTKPSLLSEDVAKIRPSQSGDYVKLQVIFYWAYRFDPASKHPEHLKRIVFVDGHTDPVVDEDLGWQQWVEPEIVEAKVDPNTGQQIAPAYEKPGYYVGVRRLPIRVGTLDYISDLATPPSDSRAGRSQVRELIKSRSQMLRQRDRSIPVRWFDTNRVDEEILTKLKNGEWDGDVPVNGPGDRVIGEVARANYPRENFTFQNVIGSDLDRAWSLSNNQLASQAGQTRSATEASLIQSAANVRLEYEKNRVAKYIIGGVEVLAGLVQMFADQTEYVQITGEGGAKRMESWDKTKVRGEYAFDIVPDSGDRLDPGVRQERLLKLYNLAANDPTINRPLLTKKLVEAFGEDPALLTQPMPEKAPEPANISFRYSGEDMTNPMAAALLLKTYQITDADLTRAIQLIQSAVRQIQTPAAPFGGAPQSPVDQQQVEPPETVSPITKRAVDGSRLI